MDNILYGLIGRKLGHSFSADWFNNKFGVEHINAEYRLFELSEIAELSELLRTTPTLKGLNVTIPYKEQVIPYLDLLSKEAAAIGAVNVVKIVDTTDGKELRGYNSDAYGFEMSIRPLLPKWGDTALMLGTGGASKAVEYVLRKLGYRVIPVSRKGEVQLVDVMRMPKEKKLSAVSYDSLTPELVARIPIVVNATPVGMYPSVNQCPSLPYQALTDRHLCYDLVYNPSQTLFLRKAMERGAEVKNGLEMLHLQAERAWQIWNE